MKYYNPSNSQLFKTYNETKDWLDKMEVKKYKIDKATLVVDVYGTVKLHHKNMETIPIKFGKVSERFDINNSKNLTSLIGCPDSSTGIHCNSTGIKSFNGLGDVQYVSAYILKDLESFDGLPNELKYLDIRLSCDNVNSLDHFPKVINGVLWIGLDFKWFDTLYKHLDMCKHIYLGGWLGSYGNILKLLYVKGVEIISSNSTADKGATDILNAEIKRQPDPRKRNLLKVAQELSNAGYHHLTV